jgi:hypothetical protein
MRRTKLALIGFFALGIAVTVRGDSVVASAVAVTCRRLAHVSTRPM